MASLFMYNNRTMSTLVRGNTKQVVQNDLFSSEVTQRDR